MTPMRKAHTNKTAKTAPRVIKIFGIVKSTNIDKPALNGDSLTPDARLKRLTLNFICLIFVEAEGIEPPTQTLSISPCSTN